MFLLGKAGRRTKTVITLFLTSPNAIDLNSSKSKSTEPAQDMRDGLEFVPEIENRRKGKESKKKR